MPAKSAVAVGGDHELAVQRNIHAPGWTGRCPLRPQRLAILVVAAQRPRRAKDEALLVRRNSERAHFFTALEQSSKLRIAILQPVLDGRTGGVADGKVVQLSRRVSQMLSCQIEKNWALAANFEPKPDATPVYRKGEAFLIQLITRVSLYWVPPEPTLAVGANQSEGRAIRADRNVLTTGKEMICRTQRPLNFLWLTFTRPVPYADGLLPPLISTADIEPSAVLRPSDTTKTESEGIHLPGIGCE